MIAFLEEGLFLESITRQMCGRNRENLIYGYYSI
jgi:hypothetical protein